MVPHQKALSFLPVATGQNRHDNETLPIELFTHKQTETAMYHPGKNIIFYQRGRISNVLNKQGMVMSTVMSTAGPLAEKEVDPQQPVTRLLAIDQQRSPWVVINKEQESPRTFSPYGYSSEEQRTLSLTAFTGEISIVSGAYLLGSERVYNPLLMRFNSPDFFSPFAIGGLNAYCYCLCDPINHIDPSGRVTTKTLALRQTKIKRQFPKATRTQKIHEAQWNKATVAEGEAWEDVKYAKLAVDKKIDNLISLAKKNPDKLPSSSFFANAKENLTFERQDLEFKRIVLNEKAAMVEHYQFLATSSQAEIAQLMLTSINKKIRMTRSERHPIADRNPIRPLSKMPTIPEED